MGLFRFTGAMFLAGVLFLLGAGLIVLLFWTWSLGQWWWSLLCFAVLAGWAYFATRTKAGEKRNDFGV